MRLKLRDGTLTQIDVTEDQLLALAQASLDGIRRRSSVVECADCGERFLVNNQDFHLVSQCELHRNA